MASLPGDKGMECIIDLPIPGGSRAAHKHYVYQTLSLLAKAVWLCETNLAEMSGPYLAHTLKILMGSMYSSDCLSFYVQ